MKLFVYDEVIIRCLKGYKSDEHYANRRKQFILHETITFLFSKQKFHLFLGTTIAIIVKQQDVFNEPSVLMIMLYIYMSYFLKADK
jgi:hypothetical protein